MNIRSAILAAADHIEANPGEFRFFSINLPSAPSCGTPGCALGWITYFAGLGGHYNAALHFLGVENEKAFYSRMHDVCSSRNKWIFDAALCARTLRAYADRWHPASPSLDPAYVAWRDALEVEHGYARSGADG